MTTASNLETPRPRRRNTLCTAAVLALATTALTLTLLTRCAAADLGNGQSFYAAHGVFCLVEDGGVDCILGHRLYALRPRGRARSRAVGDGDGGDAAHMPYGRWYVILGARAERRPARDPHRVSCIARRGTGLRCVNRDQHGFSLGGIDAPRLV